MGIWILDPSKEAFQVSARGCSRCETFTKAESIMAPEVSWCSGLFFFFFFGLPWVFAAQGRSLLAVCGLLIAVTSLAAYHRLQAHRLNCATAHGITPNQGSNPCPLHWWADSEPLGHQERVGKDGVREAEEAKWPKRFVSQVSELGWPELKHQLYFLQVLSSFREVLKPFELYFLPRTIFVHYRLSSGLKVTLYAMTFKELYTL